ncbi:hypothetical protein [Piscinibacter gummiphilus]|uniref:Uncharacterized protein n=1 Tax=Piscinibacter gummiphilus TaxID=946333 RepID=A0ABZ0CN63_9BURK|nr:hypothetical protein [Piscinibacter gummiphilus]WOB05961.1 hypothetical protein RXV79_13625 [Piscinibacter gummiphilus]
MHIPHVMTLDKTWALSAEATNAGLQDLAEAQTSDEPARRR